MNRTININIAGVQLNFETEAYNKLKQYLQQLRNSMANSAEATEVINDIEARIVELIKARIDINTQAVTTAIIDEIIAIIGQPQDFENDDASFNETSSNSTKDATVNKRLYRNIDRKVIGGVCSGLGAYFNFDPILVRIVFLLLVFIPFLHGSFVIPLYIILWIAIPAARTNAQKLEMRGEPVNWQNLQNFARNEYESIKNNMEQYHKSGKFQNFLNEFARIIGNLFRFIIKGFAIIIGVILIFVGFALLAVFIGNSESLNFNQGIFNMPSFKLLFSNLFPATIKVLLIICLLFIVLVPVLYLGYMVARAFFRAQKVSKLLTIMAVVIWFAALFGFAYTIVFQFKQFKQQAEVVNETIQNVTNNKLTIQLAENTANNNIVELVNFQIYTLYKNTSTAQLIGKPKVVLQKAISNKWSVVITKKARGNNFTQAQLNAEEIYYTLTNTDSTLTLQPWFILPQNKNWRLQELYITINIPNGAVIYINANLAKYILECDNLSGLEPEQMAGKYWEMTNDGLHILE